MAHSVAAPQLLIPSLAELKSHAAATATDVLGIYNPFLAGIELTERPHLKQFAVLRSMVDEYAVLRSQCSYNDEPFDAEKRLHDLGDFLMRCIPNTPSLHQGEPAELQKLFESQLVGAFEYVRGNYLLESDACTRLRHKILLEAVRLSTLPHEMAHFALSNGSAAQSYCIWLTWIQSNLIAGFLSKVIAVGLPVPQGPLFNLLTETSPQYDAFDIKYRLRNWWYIEEFLSVLTGKRQVPVMDTVILTASADSQFKFTTAQFMDKLELHPRWEIEATLPNLACPTDNDGNPFGIESIQEGFAAVRCDMYLGLSYRDLMNGIENPTYHGEYFRLPSRVARELKLSHPDWFRYTFLALCDLAMSSHLHPATLHRFKVEYRCSWQDLHPGWRFERALRYVSSRGDLFVNKMGDYSAFVEAICEAMRWPTPKNIAQAMLEFNEKTPDSLIIAPLIARESQTCQARLNNPTIIVDVGKFEQLKIRPVTLRDKEGFWARPEEEAFMLSSLGMYVHDLRSYVLSDTRQNPSLPFKKSTNSDYLYNLIKEMTGLDLRLLWRA